MPKPKSEEKHHRLCPLLLGEVVRQNMDRYLQKRWGVEVGNVV